MSCTDHKARIYVVFSIPLLPSPSYAQISSSAPYLRTPSAYVPPSIYETKFYNHTKQKVKIYENEPGYVCVNLASRILAKSEEICTKYEHNIIYVLQYNTTANEPFFFFKKMT